MAREDYEIVIGLEVHCELSTKTKIFCSCSTEFGGDPNTHCCPICMAMPGTLPVLNEKVVEYAVKAGLATNCSIEKNSKNDRKNYFYPDNPKSYQISQFDKPLCYDGHVTIETEDGEKEIRIERIHIEEDAGKLNHDEYGRGSFVDLNRAGVPLIEVVSKPDMRSAKEVESYMRKLKSIFEYIEISDCKMQEGSLRADVNVSVRKKGETKFGTRTEMKNMNSFRSIVRAIEYEANRQIDVIENGGEITQETLPYAEQTDSSVTLLREYSLTTVRLIISQRIFTVTFRSTVRCGNIPFGRIILMTVFEAVTAEWTGLYLMRILHHLQTVTYLLSIHMIPHHGW